MHFFQNAHGGGGGGPQGGNYGTMEAADGGVLIFDGGLDNFDLVGAFNGGLVYLNNGIKNHAGTVDAAGAGSQIFISGGNQSENAAQILAEHDGVISLASVMLKNDAGATIDAASGGSISWIAGGIDNFGTFSAGNDGTITFGGDIDIINEVGGTFQAALGGSIIFGGADTGSVNNNGGMILATDGGTITFDSTLDGVENTGTIEAGTGGTIIIDGFQHGNGVINAANNTIGIIEAVGSGAKVELDGATIIGGKLHSQNGGVFETIGGTSTLVDVIITGGDFKLDAHTVLDLKADSSGVAAYIDSTVIFEGPGVVQMDSPSTKILAGASGGTLNNQTTIEGQGTIGSGDTPAAPGFGLLTLINSGTIEAVGGEFIIDTGMRSAATTTNSGMLEANGANAVLLIEFTNINNTNGTIAALNGLDAVYANASVVELLDVNIVGGKLETSNFGIIETITDHGAATTSSFDNVTNDGYVYVSDNTTLILRDTITNTEGKIALGFGGNATLQIDGTVTLAGGSVELNGGNDKIVAHAAGAKLDNTSTIHGAGQIGADDRHLTLDNQSGGTVNADINGATLTIHTGNTVTNAGTLEAMNGGTLQVDDAVNNCDLIEALSGGIVTFGDGATIHNSGGAAIAALCGGTVNLNGTTVYNRNGSIEADGIGAMVMLAGAMILGGTLETSAHGIIETVADSGNTTFDGVTIAAGSNVQVSDDTTLTLQDTIDCNATVTNDGTITLVQGCHSSLIINGNITLAGSGTVVLSGDSDSIVGTGKGTNTLHNANTIEGSGTIGGDDLVFINQACGIVDADMCGHTLVLDTGTTVVNLGLLEATHGGTLEIEDSVCNVGGTIAANGHGSIVDLVGVTITGGTLETSCGGLIETTGTSTLLNVTIADGGTLEAGTGATFLLEGTTTVSDPVTFEGGGTFELSGDGAKIVGSGGNAELHNYGTIAGAGTIGNCALSVTNECSGIIDATGCLTINLVPNTLTNYGLMEATDGGELNLLSTVSNFNVIAAYAGSTVYLDDTVFNSHGGEVIASGHCAVVDLFNATIRGGTIESDCGGLIQTVAGWDGAATTSTLDGVTIGCGSDVKVADQTTLILEDGTTMFGGRLSIACSGVLDVEHGGNDGCGGATLDGVNVTDNGAIDIGDVSSGAILTLDDGTTITGHGTGTLTVNADNTLDVEHGGNDGCGGATFDGVHVTDNGALDIGDDLASGATLMLDGDTCISGCGAMTINAGNTLDVDGGTTRIDLGGTITNNGTIEASCGGELDVVSHVDNSSGMLEAKSGGKLDIESSISGGSATIQGGTLEFGGKSNVDVTFDNCHGYGQLTLDHAENFCGTITDFSGTCADSAHSDVIDLKDINFNSCGFHECYDAATGMLTITDGCHTAYLKFEDFHGTFKFGSDGGNGTDIYDPPATGSKDAPSTTTATTTLPTTTTSVGSDHTAVPADQNGFGNDHGVTSAPGTPTLAANAFGASGNDSFTFHPNLGGNPAQNTDAHTDEIAHSNGQISGPALASIAPEFHQEFAFDVIHQDLANLAATVDQFHQMASNSTLLH